MDRYFAYGSNLKPSRLRARVPSAHPVGAARLPGMRLTLDKRGSDGSGKANLTADSEAHVWGVVYTLDPGEWPLLDACEPRYERRSVQIVTEEERSLAITYVSEWRTREPLAHDWYKRLIVEGAHEHGLPDTWLALLEALPTRAQDA